ncbi:TrbI/VirB10 family protein [Plastorhodobacter daqingensis]|uniref:TrbI/VirB10 family protein n=1 Tax=Plastorhodobacter daqingensis TaxID=1387281 RepID=A0ABW2UN88_9RHOB
MTNPAPTAEAAAPMRLRPNPPVVTRLSRKVLTGVGIAASLAVAGALIYALQPRGSGPGGEELFSVENRPTADGLAGLPSDYTGPVLGPPLPGDLGRPILDAQTRGQPAAPPVIVAPTPDPDEQRRLAEEEAARLSQVFFQTAPASNMAASAPPPNFPGPGAMPIGGQTTQDRQLAFLNASPDRQPVSTERILEPASPFLLQAGAVIPAALITGIRSDLPGQITAQVTENVYDSPSGRYLLVPQGTRIVGEYSSDVGFGQRRVLLVWNRLIFPNGRSITLERLPGTDAQGFAGLEDGVDYHWGNVARAAGLATLLAFVTELATDDEDRLVQALREGALDTIDDVGQQIVQRQLQVPPTLTIRQGFSLRVVVTRDLVLQPFGG